MKSLFLILLIASTNIVLAGDGAHGGGLGEKNVVFAFFSLEQNISDCLGSTFCSMDKNETALLSKILTSLRNKQETISQLEFKSEKAEPGFFILFKQVKSAKTGGAAGSKIYINTDHLYRLDPAGFTRPISVMEAITLLLHELSHHHGIKDGAEELRKVDILCAKFVKFVEQYGLGAFRNTQAAQLGIQKEPQLLLECIHDFKELSVLRIWAKDVPVSYSITEESVQNEYAYDRGRFNYVKENLNVRKGDEYFEKNPDPRIGKGRELLSFDSSTNEQFHFSVNLLDHVSRTKGMKDFSGYTEIDGKIKNYRCNFVAKGRELATDTRWMFLLH